eukprot:m.296535 g.296535  ORF g.296535 m.296535 type:complete len:254 (-) comp27192_c0_seq13:2273-3034(-)
MRVPPDRQTKMAAVASRRLSGVTCVLEGLYDTGNIGAVARSAESFGITNLGVITLHGDKFKTKHGGRTAGGAEKWIDFTKFPSTEECYSQLREDGHKIFVASCAPRIASGTSTSAHDDDPAMDQSGRTVSPDSGSGVAPTPLQTSSVPLADVDWSSAGGKVAIVFGNEYMGLSDAAVDLADESFHVETNRFTQSLNVSVAAAVVFHQLSLAFPRPTEEEQRASLADMSLRMAMTRGVTLDGLIDLCKKYDGTL